MDPSIRYLKEGGYKAAKEEEDKGEDGGGGKGGTGVALGQGRW